MIGLFGTNNGSICEYGISEAKVYLQIANKVRRSSDIGARELLEVIWH